MDKVRSKLSLGYTNKCPILAGLASPEAWFKPSCRRKSCYAAGSNMFCAAQKILTRLASPEVHFKSGCKRSMLCCSVHVAPSDTGDPSGAYFSHSPVRTRLQEKQAAEAAVLPGATCSMWHRRSWLGSLLPQSSLNQAAGEVSPRSCCAAWNTLLPVAQHLLGLTSPEA